MPPKKNGEIRHNRRKWIHIFGYFYIPLGGFEK